MISQLENELLKTKQNLGDSINVAWLRNNSLIIILYTCIKNNKIKSTSDKIKVFFIEYVNEFLSDEYYSNNKEGVDIFSFLYYKINEICLELKTVCTDEIMVFILTNKINKINSIIIDDFEERQNKIKELELEIKKLKKGMV